MRAPPVWLAAGDIMPVTEAVANAVHGALATLGGKGGGSDMIASETARRASREVVLRPSRGAVLRAVYNVVMDAVEKAVDV